MGLIQRIFGQRRDPLEERAGMLLSGAHALAISGYTAYSASFPLLESVDVEQWDFVMTVAGVFIAASRLSNLKVGDVREERLMDIVSEKLAAWKPDGVAGFLDCKGLYEETYDRLARSGTESRFLAADALGFWIMFNLLQRAPSSEEEWKLVRFLGAILVQAFFDWWS